MNDSTDAFAVQGDVRQPWRRYLDSLTPLRPGLHRYCCRLTGNLWDGEDLVQDTLVRVFSLLGKTDANLQSPRAYLIRTATNLWIDRVRRSAREMAALQLEAAEDPTQVQPPAADTEPATRALFRALHPQERAAIVMKEVLGLSLDETATMLKTSVGAVKSALHRARDRLSNKRKPAGFDAPPLDVVERFVTALRNQDAESLRAICSADLSIDMVGSAEMNSFEESESFFGHAHMVMPALGFGENPWWKVVEYESEPMVIGYRTLDGIEGLNEIHRLEVTDGRVVRIRCYCFCPDTLRIVADNLGIPALRRPYRSPG
jgi:RNA polymerase sigma-70 factor (ECF subfamily)